MQRFCSSQLVVQNIGFDLEIMPITFKGMSAFAFMAFAMAVVNAALSTANNVNDNNNNNNNNNNDNNNNLANINVANANNAANNENMAMAGRRRRLQRLETNSSTNISNKEVESRPELFATRVMLEDDQLVYAPIRIGYDDQGQEEETNEPSSEPPLLLNLSTNISSIPTSTLTNSKSTPPSSSYLDRLLASANSLLGRRRKRNAFESRLEDSDHFESKLEDFNHFESRLEDSDQLEGELAQIALTFIGQIAFASFQCCICCIVIF